MAQSEERNDGWIGALTAFGFDLFGDLRELLDPDGESALVGRWAPVIAAARSVVSSLAEVAWYLVRRGGEEGAPADALIDELSRRTEALVGAFPNVADIYADADAFDRRLRDGLDKSGDDVTLFPYLEWLYGFVDAVIERAVEVALGEADRELTPERATEFLERVDEMLGVLLDRWVFPSVIDPGPERPDGGESGVGNRE